MKRDIGRIEEGHRCLYGKIIHVWSDPSRPHYQWVLIKNDSSRAPKGTFSFYSYRTDVNGGSLSTSHFIPLEILRELGSLDSSDFVFGPQVDHSVIEESFSDLSDESEVSVKKEKSIKKDKFSKETSKVPSKKASGSILSSSEASLCGDVVEDTGVGSIDPEKALSVDSVKEGTIKECSMKSVKKVKVKSESIKSKSDSLPFKDIFSTLGG